MNNKKGAIPFETTPLTQVKDTTKQAVEQLETVIQILINTFLTELSLLIVIIGSGGQ